jgi:hypothetical protein
MCLKKRMEYARWQDAYEISYGAIDKANCALRLRLTALTQALQTECNS